ncbi:MAG: calcium-binding protein [Pseudomonadota bacterium]
MATVTLDFNLAGGTILDDEYAAQGVTISADQKNSNIDLAMVFDTDNPTGGDHDLAYTGLGGALIISEDGHSHDPDDSAKGGDVTFDFANPVDLTSITLLDAERGATFTAFDAAGNQIGVVTAGNGSDNDQRTIDLSSLDGVSKLVANIKGSGALDNLTFDTVEETANCDDHAIPEKGGTTVTTLDFNLAAGTIVDDEYAAQGVTISADQKKSNIDLAMVFDSDAPTGGDFDLGYDGLGGILIISEDGHQHDPDDAAKGGTITFDFDDPADLTEITLLDSERGAKFTAYDADGNKIGTVNVGKGSDNDQRTIDLSSLDGVSKLVVKIKGSGALDNLTFETKEGSFCSSDFAKNGLSIDTTQPGVIIGNPAGGPVFGTMGDDVISADGPFNIVDAMDGDDLIATGAGVDSIEGGEGNDTIDAGEGVNFINGGEGDNLMRAGSGDDAFTGGEGNDFAVSTGGTDMFDLGNGDNVVCAGDGDDNITTGHGDDCIEAGDGDNLVNAGGGNNFVETGDGADKVISGTGDDTISTGDGNDVVENAGGDNLVDAGAGNDFVILGAGDDTALGGDGNDHLCGGDGADVLCGGDGDDTLEGQAGDDILTGGGWDRNVFKVGEGHDTITDFDTDSSGSEISRDTLEFAFDRDGDGTAETVSLSLHSDFEDFFDELNSDGDAATSAFVSNGNTTFMLDAMTSVTLEDVVI